MADEPITREELLDELIAALRDTAPPPDAFCVNDIMERTGWQREQVYGYLKKARAEGKVEMIGRFGAYSYYRKSPIMVTYGNGINNGR